MACSNEYSLESLDRGVRAVVCRRSARRTVAWWREALIAIVSSLALFAGATSAHAQSYPAPSWSSVLGTFIPIESSDLAGLAPSLPAVYPVRAVDTSGWMAYDVTCESDGSGSCPAAPGTQPFPSSWGCAPMVGNGVTDDGPALQCQFGRLNRREYLYIPDGTGDYVLDSVVGDDIAISPGSADDQTGLICESRNAVLSSHAGWGSTGTQDVLRPIRTIGNTWPSSGMSWNGGAGSTKGSTVLPVANASSFSVGDWVVARANRTQEQDGADRVWATKVTAVGGGSITIEHPLPEDFTGGSATVGEWDPLEQFVVRNCTIEYEDGHHVSSGRDALVHLYGCAECEVSNVEGRHGYRTPLMTEQTADILIQHSDFHTPRWDKAVNGYGFALGGTSRVWIHDNTIQHVTAIAVGAEVKAALITFNDLISPESNPDYDIACDEPFGLNSPGPNDCIIDTSHQSHEPTVGRGHLHCSSRERDALGADSDTAACRGTPAGALYSCMEWHNRAGSHGLAMRNYCDGSMWYDWGSRDGPGRDNVFFGNWFADPPLSEVDRFPQAPGGVGSFAWVDIGTPPDGYRRNDKFANNLFERNFGRGNGFDTLGDGIVVTDNVIGGTCEHDSAGGDVTGGQCQASNAPYANGIGTVWTHNTVGDDRHPGSYSRTMPTLPGFSNWPEFSPGTTQGLTPPFVGPEMGDPDTYEGCLPARMRLRGGC